MIKIATWNVNSVKARLPLLLRWLEEFSPDVLLLQELKCIEEAFPRDEIEDKGYNIAVKGQKTYNGVAILSKSPIEIDLTELPGDGEDLQARYIEAFTFNVRVSSIYVPNGNPVETDKFPYKISFMERLHNHVKLYSLMKKRLFWVATTMLFLRNETVMRPVIGKVMPYTGLKPMQSGER